MEAFYDLKEMLCKELEEITQKGQLSAGDLDVVDKLTHSIKSLETIIAMKEASDEGSYEGSYDGSYEGYYDGRSGRNGRNRGGRSRDGGMSGARRRRDSMGRYTSRDGRYYSGDMKDQLEDMIAEAGSEQERQVLREAISQLR